jgi:ATP-binding cassette subfamily A (ABC1) protein 2
MRGLVTQILLPAFFITVAMTVALTAPGFADPPPITLSTAMFSPLNYLYTPVSGLNSYKSKNRPQIYSLNANPYDLSSTIRYPSGIGSTCLLNNPYMNESTLLFDNLTGLSCDQVYNHDFRSYSNNDINWLERFEHNETYFNRTYSIVQSTLNKYYSPCQCSESQSRFQCPIFPKLDSDILITNDQILNITAEENEILYYLYTADKHHLDRYGGLSFGLTQDYIPDNYPIHKDNQILQKLAVKNIARIFTNHKGYHSLPLYINIMSNIILRANLPFEKGLPSAYGITTINHPMNETNNMLSTEFILQGSDVIISIFIIVAMSFVPASFTLFLVHERATKSKHIQYINGLYPLIYWLTNFVWDLLNYLLPAACVIVILRLFNVPAYVEGENFLAVISLFLMYGWSIIPVMYPFSFRFTEPSNAYIFLIVINLFSGITCIYTSFFLEIFALGSPATSKLSIITRTVKKLFKIFPNYCLGRGLIDIAYNVSQIFHRNALR